VGVGRDLPAGPASPAQVELRLAGTFSVVRDGIELADGEVGSRKSRTLLKLLAVSRPGLVPVDRIVDVLWADGPPAAAEQNVATLVSRLRGVLGPGVILGGRKLLGYNPVQTLLGHALTGLPASHVAYLTGRTFFPSLISAPFEHGLPIAFDFAIAACLIAALASLLRGGRYVHELHAEPAGVITAPDEVTAGV
jgi:hypothetical protein